MNNEVQDAYRDWLNSTRKPKQVTPEERRVQLCAAGYHRMIVHFGYTHCQFCKKSRRDILVEMSR